MPVKKFGRMLLLIIVVATIFSGCVMRTVDELYCLPKRSQSDDDMQAVIDKAMVGLMYCAPVYGENRQMVQPADLDGDGVDEYVVLAKGGSLRQLKIMIFGQYTLGYELTDTIESYGSAFDFIQFANVDNQPGDEIIVGRQVGDGVVRSAAVYRFQDGDTHQLLEASYVKFLTSDLNEDGRSELITIHPGETGDVVSKAIVYRFESGVVQPVSEIEVSAAADRIKRIEPIVLQDKSLAILVVAEEGENQLMEIVSFKSGALYHVYGPAIVKRLHDNFAYPMDSDGDGDVEIPELVPMLDKGQESAEESWILWFGVDAHGKRTDGMYTYYSHEDKWYIHVNRLWVNQLTVTRSEGVCIFYNREDEVVMTIYALTGANRREQAQQLGGIVLGSSDTITFAATIGPIARDFGITEQRVKQMFYGLNLALYTEEE
jgi:hypothetical protein